jgi:hypothetical protein
VSPSYRRRPTREIFDMGHAGRGGTREASVAQWAGAVCEAGASSWGLVAVRYKAPQNTTATRTVITLATIPGLRFTKPWCSESEAG